MRVILKEAIKMAIKTKWAHSLKDLATKVSSRRNNL